MGVQPRTPPSSLKRFLVDLIIVVVVTFVIFVVVNRWKSGGKNEGMELNLKAAATVVVYGSDGKPMGQGSGFFINNTGLLVTAAHVVKGLSSARAKLPSGAFYDLKEIKTYDRIRDIALLQFDAKETPSVTGLGNSDEVSVGEKVYAIGTPTGVESTLSEGNISNPNQELNGLKFIQFTAPISPGSSGGGLFNQDGYVIGITTLTHNNPKAQNLNLAVPINDLKTTIVSNKYPFQGSAVYYYAQATLANNQKNWDKAISLYAKAIELDSSNIDAYMGLGGAYFSKGDYENELECYLLATKLDPSSGDAFYYLGTAYQDMGEYDKAYETFKESFNIDPENKDLIHDFAMLCLASGNKDGAALLIKELNRLDPGWAAVLQAIMNRQR